MDKKLTLVVLFFSLNGFSSSTDKINTDTSTRWVQDVHQKALNRLGEAYIPSKNDISSIVVDISEQRLYFVKNSKIISSFKLA